MLLGSVHTQLASMSLRWDMARDDEEELLEELLEDELWDVKWECDSCKAGIFLRSKDKSSGDSGSMWMWFVGVRSYLRHLRH